MSEDRRQIFIQLEIPAADLELVEGFLVTLTVILEKLHPTWEVDDWGEG